MASQGETGHLAGHQGEHSARPGVALPRQKLRPPEHQDGVADHRATRQGGQLAGSLAQAEALSQEGDTSYPPAQPRSECSHGRRARAHDQEAGGAQEAVHDGDLCHRGAGAEKEAYDGWGFGPTNGKMK